LLSLVPRNVASMEKPTRATEERQRASPAAEMPLMYRAVLDLVVELERMGAWRDAAEIRAEAIRSYSALWDRGSFDSMSRLGLKAIRLVDGRRAHPQA
jgi:hypothetical protein